MRNDERLLRDVQATSFLAHDILLYLDTHPDDREAFEAYQRALGDRRRLKIVRALMLRPHNASEIADLTQLSPATVSYHMTELVNKQLVSAEATGSRVLYRLNSEGLRALMDDLGAMVGKGS